MARPLSWAFAALLVLSGSAVGAAERCEPQQRGGQPPSGRSDRSDKPGDKDGHPSRPKWWIDTKIRSELGITDQQSAAVEQIWQKTAPGLRESWAKLEKLEDALIQLTKDDSVAEATVVAQIEQVEKLRADANMRRTVMIYRMNRLLTPDQRSKVKAMYERPGPQRRGPSSR